MGVASATSGAVHGRHHHTKPAELMMEWPSLPVLLWLGYMYQDTQQQGGVVSHTSGLYPKWYKCRAATRPSPPLLPGPAMTSTLLWLMGGYSE